jgi:hypothetical protein
LSSRTVSKNRRFYQKSLIFEEALAPSVLLQKSSIFEDKVRVLQKALLSSKKLCFFDNLRFVFKKNCVFFDKTFGFLKN